MVQMWPLITLQDEYVCIIIRGSMFADVYPYPFG